MKLTRAIPFYLMACCLIGTSFAVTSCGDDDDDDDDDDATDTSTDTGATGTDDDDATGTGDDDDDATTDDDDDTTDDDDDATTGDECVDTQLNRSCAACAELEICQNTCLTENEGNQAAIDACIEGCGSSSIDTDCRDCLQPFFTCSESGGCVDQATGSIDIACSIDAGCVDSYNECFCCDKIEITQPTLIDCPSPTTCQPFRVGGIDAPGACFPPDFDLTPENITGPEGGLLGPPRADGTCDEPFIPLSGTLEGGETIAFCAGFCDDPVGTTVDFIECPEGTGCLPFTVNGIEAEGACFPPDFDLAPENITGDEGELLGPCKEDGSCNGSFVCLSGTLEGGATINFCAGFCEDPGIDVTLIECPSPTSCTAFPVTGVRAEGACFPADFELAPENLTGNKGELLGPCNDDGSCSEDLECITSTPEGGGASFNACVGFCDLEGDTGDDDDDDATATDDDDDATATDDDDDATATDDDADATATDDDDDSTDTAAP